MIPQSEVSILARKYKIGDRTIEKDYCLSWMLVGIYTSNLRDELAFKGGTAIKKVYYPEYRFSEDHDFSLVKTLSNSQIQDVFERACGLLMDLAGIQYTIKKYEEPASHTLTIYINYVGPLQAVSSERTFKVDITKDEKIVCPLRKNKLKTFYSDLKNSRTKLYVYSMEEILVEKLCALASEYRKEPRDLFDVYFIFENASLDIDKVKDALLEKAKYKNIEIKNLLKDLDKKFSYLEKMWQLRLRGQVDTLPKFEGAFRVTRKHIKQLKIL